MSCDVIKTSASAYMLREIAAPLITSDNMGLNIVGRLCTAVLSLVALIESVVRLILAVPAIPLAHCLDTGAKKELYALSLGGSLFSIEAALFGIAVTCAGVDSADSLDHNCVRPFDRAVEPVVKYIFGL